jgi:hypothetical protein
MGVYTYTPTSHGRLQRGDGGCEGAPEDRLSSSSRRQVGDSEDGGVWGRPWGRWWTKRREHRAHAMGARVWMCSSTMGVFMASGQGVVEHY